MSDPDDDVTRQPRGLGTFEPAAIDSAVSASSSMIRNFIAPSFAEWGANGSSAVDDVFRTGTHGSVGPGRAAPQRLDSAAAGFRVEAARL
jgi:hypothetical protein